MKSYTFPVLLEPDEEGWRAFYPPWEELGAATWGKTKEEARRNLQEVLTMILEELAEEGRPVPVTGEMLVREGAAVTVTHE